MAFLFGGDDAVGAEFANQSLRALRPRIGNLGLTGLRAIPGTRGTGCQLLQARDNIDNLVVLQAVSFDQQATVRWAPRESDRKAYIWHIPRSTTPIKAKGESDKTMGMIPLIPLGLTQ